MDKLPILNNSCNLSGDEFEARIEILRRELLPHVLHRESLRDGQAFEFDSSMRGQLDEFVAFEQQCCPDLHWNLSQSGGRIRLEIRGLTEDLIVE